TRASSTSGLIWAAVAIRANAASSSLSLRALSFSRPALNRCPSTESVAYASYKSSRICLPHALGTTTAKASAATNVHGTCVSTEAVSSIASLLISTTAASAFLLIASPIASSVYLASPGAERNWAREVATRSPSLAAAYFVPYCLVYFRVSVSTVSAALTRASAAPSLKFANPVYASAASATERLPLAKPSQRAISTSESVSPLFRIKVTKRSAASFGILLSTFSQPIVLLAKVELVSHVSASFLITL